MFKNIYVDRKTNTFKLWTVDGKEKEYNFKCRSWVESPSSLNTPYKTIYGVPVVPVFTDLYQESLDKKSGKLRHEIDIQPEIRILSEFYENQEVLNFKIEDYNVMSMDIEVENGSGFPEPAETPRRINLISCYSTFFKKYMVWGLKEIDRDRFHTQLLEKQEIYREKFPDINIADNYEYIDCYDDEETLINNFFTYVDEIKPDIITGWNTNKFDLPYIINRAKKLMLYSYTWLSPVRKVYLTEKFNDTFMKMELVPNIAGVSCIDYLELYKKFNLSQKADYKLDTIAGAEIGLGKIKLGDSGLSLAEKDWTMFSLYNLVDTILVALFEPKLKMLESLIGTCAEARIPLEYFFTSKRVILGFMMTYMHRKGLVIPYTKDVMKEPYDGAYIKINPKPYRWVASYDAKAMYPSIMISCNISPETKVVSDTVPDFNCSRSVLKNIYYRNDYQGIVPEIVAEIVDGRDEFKKLQKQYSNPESPKYDKEKAEYYKRKQNAYKIFANSVYGLLGNNHFQFYDVHNAATITGIGNKLIQHVITYAITWLDNKLPENENFRNEFGEYANVTIKGMLDDDYIKSFDESERPNLGKFKRLVLAHTDSFFFDYSDLYTPFEGKKRTHEEYLLIKNRFSNPESPDYNKGIEAYFKDMDERNWDEMSFTEFMLRFNHCVFDKVMGQITKKWSTMHNYREDRMWFKLEKCCNNLVALSKAHYICLLQYDEGDLLMHQPFDKRLKAVGVEMIKSDTPKWSKTNIMRVLELLFSNMSKQEISRHVGMLKKDYCDKKNIAIISRPASINTLKATLANTFPAPRLGSIIWNRILEEDKDFANYEPITEGTKIKWVAVKQPNKFNVSAISYNSENYPEELDKYFTVDFNTQMAKTFRKPLEKILECYGWSNIFDGDTDSIRRFLKKKTPTVKKEVVFIDDEGDDWLDS